MKRRTFIKIGLGTTVLAAVPFPNGSQSYPFDERLIDPHGPTHPRIM